MIHPRMTALAPWVPGAFALAFLAAVRVPAQDEAPDRPERDAPETSRSAAADDDASRADHEGDHDGEGHGIHWAESLEKALERASKLGRPVLVDFGADWCGFCKKLDRETFGDERVLRFVHDRFVAVKVDTDDHPDLEEKYGIEGLPTILVLSPEGDELQRLVGFRPPERFIEELQTSAASAEKLEELARAARERPEDTDVQRAYARALFAAGSRDEATGVLDKALERSPDHPGILLDLADIQRGAGKLKPARETYERILGLPDEKAAEEKERAFLPLGRLLIAQKEYRDAIGVLGRFIERRSSEKEAEDVPADAAPNDAAPEDEKHQEREGLWEAYFLRGYAHASMKDAESALADLKVVREKDTESPWGLRASYIIDIVEPR